MQSHLKGSAWRMSPDALISVAAVEQQALEEHLEALHHILLATGEGGGGGGGGERSLRGSTPSLVLLHSRVRALLSVLLRLGQALDSPGGGTEGGDGVERSSGVHKSHRMTGLAVTFKV
jgi:hypothetical protein